MWLYTRKIFRWVKPEWIHIKETRGENYQAIMEQRGRYNAANYDGHKLQIDTWHGPLSYDEETHFRSLEYLHAVGTQKNPKPFLLCASYHHPHEPFWPPQSYWDMYENADIEIPTLPDNLDDTYSMMDKWLNAYHGTPNISARPGRPLQLRRADSSRYILTNTAETPRIREMAWDNTPPS